MQPSARFTLRVFLSGVLVVQGAAALAVTADSDEARKMAEIRARAEQGYTDQQIELAAAYLTGRGVAQDPVQAAHWYLRAAQSGRPEAQNEIGYFYQLGVGVPRDAERAVHWFQLASAGGMERAKINLGVSYLYGTGVRKKVPMARQLFEEAVKKGSGLGATYLGVMAYFGMGQTADRDAAERWFETGAKLHDPQAAWDLALLFAAPEGKWHDLRKAVALLRFSAGKGYVEAKHALGLLILNHPELAQRDGEAWRVLKEASAAGNWKASLLLGVMARDGRMTAQDSRQAYYSFYLGGLQGAQEALRLVKPDLEALKQKLPRDQWIAADDEAQRWYEQHRTPLLFVAPEGEKERYFPLLAAAVAEPSPAGPAADIGK